MRILPQLLPATALLVLLTGMSTAHAATPPKPCDLLSHQAAEALFGAALAKTLPANPLACVYYNNTDSALVNINFQMMPDGLPAGSAAQIMKTLPHKDYQPDVVDSVSALGEQNFFITDKQIPKDTLTVLYHNAIITIIVAGAKNANLRSAMIDAMKRAMSRF